MGKPYTLAPSLAVDRARLQASRKLLRSSSCRFESDGVLGGRDRGLDISPSLPFGSCSARRLPLPTLTDHRPPSPCCLLQKQLKKSLVSSDPSRKNPRENPLGARGGRGGGGFLDFRIPFTFSGGLDYVPSVKLCISTSGSNPDHAELTACWRREGRVAVSLIQRTSLGSSDPTLVSLPLHFLPILSRL